MQEGDAFSQKLLEINLFRYQTDWSGNGPAASSDKWKAPLEYIFCINNKSCSTKFLRQFNPNSISYRILI